MEGFGPLFGFGRPWWWKFNVHMDLEIQYLMLELLNMLKFEFCIVIFKFSIAVNVFK